MKLIQAFCYFLKNWGRGVGGVRDKVMLMHHYLHALTVSLDLCACGKGFDLEYSSHPGDIENWIVKSPSMPLHGAGGG